MKVLATNKRATFDYELGERIVAGLVLSGPEVKSAKAGHASLKGSFVAIRNGEAWLTNAHINPYPGAGQHNPEDPTHPRKLLLHRKQLESMTGQKSAGLSIIPVCLFVERGLLKVELGIGRGKKKHDKRQSIKKREQDLETRRHLKA